MPRMGDTPATSPDAPQIRSINSEIGRVFNFTSLFSVFQTLLLAEITHAQQVDPAHPPHPGSIPESDYARWANVVWALSLVLSMIATLFATIVQQGFRGMQYYDTDHPPGTLRPGKSSSTRPDSNRHHHSRPPMAPKRTRS